ncbi:MAG: pyridoxamine 5'-phosphate oxidase family protein [Gammaproteobacteria bacterium]|nr:pyridoxamine 5'-phosphate oxidase family protein [Gammaproteobacteria bacterium]
MNDGARNPRRSLDDDNRRLLASLIADHRWGALATLTGDGKPMASSVAYCPAPGHDGFLLHLSRLAEHTGNLLERPSAGLLIAEPDPGDGDPQTLRRLSVQCTVAFLTAGDTGFDMSREAYLARFPHARPRFGFSDFELFLLAPERAHYVGGFARAFALDASTLTEVLRECANRGAGLSPATSGGRE